MNLYACDVTNIINILLCSSILDLKNYYIQYFRDNQLLKRNLNDFIFYYIFIDKVTPNLNYEIILVFIISILF